MKINDYDVLVIGGGPAGSSAATFARKQGLTVCVAEKENFPRFRIGESLLPQGNTLLRELGVWPKVEQAGFVKKYGAYFFLANGRAEKEVIFANGIIEGAAQTFQVDRAKFDTLLLEHAREMGADVRFKTTVCAVQPIEGGHRVSLRDQDGDRAVTATWILDAGGRENVFPFETKRALEPSPFPKRMAIYSHFRGVHLAEGIAAGHTTVVRLTDGWFWIIPIDSDRTSVGLVTTVAAMRLARAEPAKVFERTVLESSKLTELMAGATAVAPFRVTTDYSYFRRDLAKERFVMVGDAGGFFDPIFSSGVYLAMYSAKLAVETLAIAHRERRALTPRECQGYGRAVKKHAGVFQKLISAFYDNDSFSIFMATHPPLNIGGAINSIVGGHAQLTWPIWWRFRLFLLVCRIQKYFKIGQSVDFSGMGSVAQTAPTPSEVLREVQ